MSWLLLFLFMLAMHVIEDFHLQGKMADMKQASWWTPYKTMYRHDYIVVLILHGMEWSVLVSLPLLLVTGLDVGAWFFAMVVLNGLVHAAVDHLKCNTLCISLVHDQALHMIQIVGMISMTAVMT